MIFTIDAIASLIIVITILVVSYFYILKSVNELPNLESLRTGDDIVKLMEYDGTLKSLNPDLIKNKTYTLLPNKYDMLVRVSSNTQNISIGGTQPNDRFIGGGERYSVITNQTTATYLTIRYWIWLK